MAKWTERDRIWNAALKKEEPIVPSEMSEALNIGERTVRDCLNCMEEGMLLKKRGGEGTEPVRFISHVVDEDDL